MPVISVLMTAYNREKYVETAISSVLSQSFKDFELIIIDDCSDDSTLKKIVQSTESDNRVKFYSLSANVGAGAARKYAEKFATGEYISFMDSDDLLHPQALELSLETLIKFPNAYSYSKYSVIDDNGELINAGVKCDIPYTSSRMLVDFITFQFRLIPSEWYYFVGGVDDSFTYAYDYDLCLRLSEKIIPVHIPVDLYGYRRHSQTIGLMHTKEQDRFTLLAANNALKRRGLDKDYEILRTDKFKGKKFAMRIKPK